MERIELGELTPEIIEELENEVLPLNHNEGYVKSFKE